MRFWSKMFADFFAWWGLNIKFLIQTRYLGGSRLSFESRLFLKCRVPWKCLMLILSLGKGARAKSSCWYTYIPTRTVRGCLLSGWKRENGRNLNFLTIFLKRFTSRRHTAFCTEKQNFSHCNKMFQALVLRQKNENEL